MKYGKTVGVGNTATVYEWKDNKVLKLFHQDYPIESVEKEFKNARLIWDMRFSKPKAYEIISYNKQIGIIYDRLKGESLLDWLIKTGNIEECAVHMSKLHKQIIQNKINNVPNYKDFLRNNIQNAQSLKEKEEMLYKLDKLPNGNTLCHGDFHPGNIFIHNGQTTVIDFMNICRGHFLYDIARTVFLVEYTPLPVEVKEKEKLLKFRKTLADLYLREMNITRKIIEDYLSVIISARIGECSKEK
ncbi:aminoglycoside phosphotransferase family protein [Clostridium sp. Cult1]|uniref:aminoglycoside phosphotransferase family protein n=1 Tax=Clostridium sp. Cult1 TaxID=2079002 RepID=UPI001F2FEDEE|nr:aminoglycoside phosphotransferase family protein [Clostridium sp. Cult1]MCF6461989.1 aminoglycoside phosphotransferase [Clostridium sp. Cult1]